MVDSFSRFFGGISWLLSNGDLSPHPGGIEKVVLGKIIQNQLRSLFSGHSGGVEDGQFVGGRSEGLIKVGVFMLRLQSSQ